MAFTRHILASLFAISGALAHMQLQWPPALHSKFNSATPEEYIGEYRGAANVLIVSRSCVHLASDDLAQTIR
jgi:hypothetical protein